MPVIPSTQVQKMRLFVTTYLNELGATVTQEGPLLRAEFTPEQFAELEGRTQPPWGIYSYSYINDNTNSVIYLAFNAADASDTRAELIAPGSHRLQQMIASARRQGHLGRFTLLPPGYTTPHDELYYPYLLIHIKATLTGRNCREKLLHIGVDLTSGKMHPKLASQCEEGSLSATIPKRVAPRNISVAEAFELARKQVAHILRQEDDGWARAALLALAAELHTLRSYYTHQRVNTGMNQQTEQLHTLRWTEVDHRCRPRALIRPVICALVLVPASRKAVDND